MAELEWLDEAQQIYSKATTNFGYDAIENVKRRKAPKRVVAAEDRHLRQNERKVMIATTRDVRRNFALARFVLQKHIDFTVEHNFVPRTADVGFNKELRTFFKYASRPDNFDISGRCSLRRYLRLQEAARIVDGDLGSVRFRNGSIQAIESDRIRDPEFKQPEDRWVNGVQINDYGRPLNYSIHKRSETGFEWERNVPANKMLMHGFYDRFDQTRGVSPLSPVINSLKDLYESFDYALARAKVEQLFALAITRNDDFGAGVGDDDVGDERSIDFDKGPQVLDLDYMEDAKFLTTNSPGSGPQEFWKSMIMMTLKCLNIPYFFYDEKHTNFFGAKAALTLYLRSVRGWREDVVDWLNKWLCWRLQVGALRGEISLPSWFDCEDTSNWQFMPLGIEYWNPVQEITADVQAIEANLRTREEIRQERYGDSWENDVFPEIMREQALVATLPSLIQQPEETTNVE